MSPLTIPKVHKIIYDWIKQFKVRYWPLLSILAALPGEVEALWDM